MVRTVSFCFLLIIISIYVASCSSTSGGNALPQASIPPPADSCTSGSSTSCLTVSSPDSTGFVTIDGAAGSVPDSSVVQIEVSSTTGRLFQLLDNLCPSAYADIAPTACTSTLPECDAAGSEVSCSLTASSDGSFHARVLAASGSTLNITYLDSDSCDESDAYTHEVSTGALQSIDTEGVALTYRREGTDFKAFVLGTNTDSDNNIAVAVVETGEITSTTEEVIEADGNPIALAFLENADALLAFTSSKTNVMAFDSSADTDFLQNEASINMPDETETSIALVGTDVTVEHGFDYTQFANPTIDASCVDSDITSSDNIDRAFVLLSTPLESSSFIAPVALIDGLPSSPTASDLDALEAHAIYMDFSGATASDGSTLSSSDFENMIDIFVNEYGDERYLFMVASFTTGYYLIYTQIDQSALCGSLSADLNVLALPADAGTPGEGYWLGALGTRVAVSDYILIPDPENANLMALNRSSLLSTVTDLESSLLGGTDFTFTALEDSHFTSTEELIPLSVPTLDGVSFIGRGSSTHLSKVTMSFSATSSQEWDGFSFEETDPDIEIGLNPQDMDLVITNSSDLRSDRTLTTFDAYIVTLSQGVEDNGSSMIRVVNIGDI